MRSLLAVVAILTTLSTQAEPRLVAPRDGAELVGGSVVEIEWEGEIGRGVEEWEAFLSVDGGRWFSTRITPHLDASIRRFTFEVPNVATRDARILLRFGNEERETEVDVPARFAIRFDPAAVRMRVALANRDGEAARPGARGVTQWVSGARDGSELQTFTRRESSYGAPASFTTHAVHEQSADLEDADPVVPACLTAASATIAPSRARPHRVHRRRATDVLLIVRRLNL